MENAVEATKTGRFGYGIFNDSTEFSEGPCLESAYRIIAIPKIATPKDEINTPIKPPRAPPSIDANNKLPNIFKLTPKIPIQPNQ